MYVSLPTYVHLPTYAHAPLGIRPKLVGTPGKGSEAAPRLLAQEHPVPSGRDALACLPFGANWVYLLLRDSPSVSPTSPLFPGALATEGRKGGARWEKQLLQHHAAERPRFPEIFMTGG